jgi:hypothetical protein
MAFPIHRYFLDRTYTGGAVRELPYPRWDRTLPPELRYPYDVLEAALPQVEAEGLHFHFTKDAYILPEYGPHVVPVLLQEERCKVPVYGRHVRATIRNLMSHPCIGFRAHPAVGRLEAVLLFEYARDWYTHLKSVRALADPPPAWGSPIRPDPLVIRLPLGYHSQEELPQIPMAERSLDAFFAGQVKHDVPRSDYRHWVSTSKFIAREQLWKELQRLERTGSWRIDLGKIASTDSRSAASAYDSYSEKMMRTRICVAPRGSVADSYRAFEGLRAGCLVVANRLPEERFLANSPILQIDHWRELEGILRKYARDIDLLERARAASLDWWRTHLSTHVVGKHVAEALNQAGVTLQVTGGSVR